MDSSTKSPENKNCLPPSWFLCEKNATFREGGYGEDTNNFKNVAQTNT